MTHTVIEVASDLQRSPFLLEAMTAPHVPRGVAEGLPVNVTFIDNVKRIDPKYPVVSRTENQGHKSRTCRSEWSYLFLSSAGPCLRF